MIDFFFANGKICKKILGEIMLILLAFGNSDTCKNATSPTKKREKKLSWKPRVWLVCSFYNLLLLPWLKSAAPVASFPVFLLTGATCVLLNIDFALNHGWGR